MTNWARSTDIIPVFLKMHKYETPGDESRERGEGVLRSSSPALGGGAAGGGECQEGEDLLCWFDHCVNLYFVLLSLIWLQLFFLPSWLPQPSRSNPGVYRAVCWGANRAAEENHRGDAHQQDRVCRVHQVQDHHHRHRLHRCHNSWHHYFTIVAIIAVIIVVIIIVVIVVITIAFTVIISPGLWRCKRWGRTPKKSPPRELFDALLSLLLLKRTKHEQRQRRHQS